MVDVELALAASFKVIMSRAFVCSGLRGLRAEGI